MTVTYAWSDDVCAPSELEQLRHHDYWRSEMITEEQLLQFASAHPGVDQRRQESCRYAQKLISGNCGRKEHALPFWVWLRRHSTFEDNFDFHSDGRIVFHLAQDYYLMWKLCGVWMKWRDVRGDNGWWRHGIRIMARYQYHTIVGKDNWTKPNGRPRAQKRSRESMLAAGDARRVVADTSSSAEESQTESAKEASRQPVATAASVPVALGVPLGAPALTRSQQLEAYCGTNADLVEYATKKYGSTPGGMSTSAVKRWYRKHPWQIPEHLQGRHFGSACNDIQVCHIIPVAKGGADYVWNYGIYLKSVNTHFGEFLPREWSNYVGRHADQTAKDFARWVAKKAAAVISYGEFNPIADRLLARGR